MNDNIWIAALSLVGTVFGSWMGVRQANRLVNYRIDMLEAKVDKHNHLVERMVVVEQSTKSAHKRIDKWEGKGERE